MDVDLAALAAAAAADARVIANSFGIFDNQAAGACNGFAHAAGVDVEGVSVRYLDSHVAVVVLFHCQRRVVAEDEVDRAGDRDAAGDGDVFGHDVPAAVERAALAQLGIARDGAGFLNACIVLFNSVVDVVNRVLGLRREGLQIAYRGEKQDELFFLLVLLGLLGLVRGLRSVRGFRGLVRGLRGLRSLGDLRGLGLIRDLLDRRLFLDGYNAVVLLPRRFRRGRIVPGDLDAGVVPVVDVDGVALRDVHEAGVIVLGKRIRGDQRQAHGQHQQ